MPDFVPQKKLRVFPAYVGDPRVHELLMEGWTVLVESPAGEWVFRGFVPAQRP